MFVFVYWLTWPLLVEQTGRGRRFVIRELLWSFFLFLLLPVEPRGLVGAIGGKGQGSVLLPWLLKPEVAVEEGEKPPLTRAERRHSTTRIKRPVRLEQNHIKHDILFASTAAEHAHGNTQQKKGMWEQCWSKPLGKDLTNVLKKRLLLWCLASSSAVTNDNLHLQWSCWLCGWLGLLHVLPWLACGGWQ